MHLLELLCRLLLMQPHSLVLASWCEFAVRMQSIYGRSLHDSSKVQMQVLRRDGKCSQGIEALHK